MAPEPSTGPGRVSDRPRVFYVSYDGMGEPLGRSQVLAYLRRLAADHEITLFSFEKGEADREALAAELASYGIAWRPLRYHKRPPVLSTLIDALSGARALIGATRGGGAPAVVHVRSYVPALIAVLARRFTGGRLVFDIRGFWVDERVEGGIWPTSSPAYAALYRFAKRCERRFFAEADAVVTLTHASVEQIRSWTHGRDIPIDVIPTCADLELFTRYERRADGPRVTWVGSIGTWYRFDLAAPIAAALGMPLGVVTRQQELARKVLDGFEASVGALPLERVPGELFSGDIGLCLYVSSFSRQATAPTRLAEYLAAGMPVLVTPGVGDMEALVTEHAVGVVLRGDDGAAIETAVAELRRLLEDPGLPDRCRALAHSVFDVSVGARRYGDLYRALINRSVL